MSVKCPYCKKEHKSTPGTVIHCKCGATLHIGSNGKLSKKESPR